MQKKILTPKQLTQQREIEETLERIQPVPSSARGIITTNGFFRYFAMMVELYPTKREAYERLETFHVRITGHRKYTEYMSFRSVYFRRLSSGRK